MALPDVARACSKRSQEHLDQSGDCMAMRKMNRGLWAFLLMFLVFVLKYRMPEPERYLAPRDDKGPRKIAVFFDGTENGPASQTNVYKLYRQVRTMPEVSTFYEEGVGFGKKSIGAGTGWGIDLRTQQAYAFLLQHYRRGDSIYVFGFSRGAFTARILSAMLQYAGLPEHYRNANVCALAGQPALDPDLQCALRVSEAVYRSYKGDKAAAARTRDIAVSVNDMGLAPSMPVPVAVLGLWDTVEALGLVDTLEAIQVKLGIDVKPDPGERNKRYGDQLCNVGAAFQALSIDDNRADLFTPKLLTLPHLYDKCAGPAAPRALYDYARVNEVWFPGAHSDVGGGYDDCKPGHGCLSDISLNWMMRQLSRGSAPLFPVPLPVLEMRGQYRVHDAQNGNMLYRRVNRDIRALTSASTYNGGKPKIHCSAIQQLAGGKPMAYQFDWGIRSGSSFSGREGKGCFAVTQQAYRYLGSQVPEHACSDANIESDLPSCWFTVVH